MGLFQHKFESEKEHRYLLQLLSNLDLALFNLWIFTQTYLLSHFNALPKTRKASYNDPIEESVSVTAQPFVGNSHTIYTSKNRKKRGNGSLKQIVYPEFRNGEPNT